MLLAAYLDTGYKVMVFLHILSFIVAFAPVFVWPFVSMGVSRQGGDETAVAKLAAGWTAKVYGPALAVGGLLGFGIAGMSKPEGADKGIYSMSDPWLSAAAVVWLLLLGIYFGLIAPAEKKAAQGDTSVVKLLSMANGIVHLLAAVALYLMVFKPGA